MKKVAFIGYTGSGKRVISTLFVKYLKNKGYKVLHIDEDNDVNYIVNEINLSEQKQEFDYIIIASQYNPTIGKKLSSFNHIFCMGDIDKMNFSKDLFKYNKKISGLAFAKTVDKNKPQFYLEDIFQSEEKLQDEVNRRIRFLDNLYKKINAGAFQRLINKIFCRDY